MAGYSKNQTSLADLKWLVFRAVLHPTITIHEIEKNLIYRNKDQVSPTPSRLMFEQVRIDKEPVNPRTTASTIAHDFRISAIPPKVADETSPNNSAVQLTDNTQINKR